MGRSQKKFDDKRKWCNAGSHWCPLDAFGDNKKTASGKRWYCRACENENKYKWRDKASHQAYMRNYMRFKTHGISEDEVRSMLETQHGLCAICEDPIDMRANVDHDHVTETIRGLLCARCNKGLGLFRDCADFLEKAAAYLRKFAVVNS
jgi:hypothetical protein